MSGAIYMMIYISVVAVVGYFYFYIRDKKQKYTHDNE